MSLFSPHDDNVPPMELKGKETMIYSDGVNSIDIRQFYQNETPDLNGEWDDILKRLEEKYAGKKPVVAIYPMGAIQIGYMNTEGGE